MGLLSVYVLTMFGAVTVKLFEKKNAMKENLILLLLFVAPVVTQSIYVMVLEWGCFK